MFRKKRAPRNTEKDDPKSFLAEAMFTGTDDSVRRQETDGQQSFIGSDTLPTDIGRYSSYDEKQILKNVGFKFFEVVEDDPIFQYVKLPEGWRKEQGGDSRWTKLIDNKGRVRANIFYKAAFYDRSAHLSLSRRFNVSYNYDRVDAEDVATADVTDCGEVIYSTDPIQLSDKERYTASEKARAMAKSWLHEHYPDWENPGAYWD